MNTTSHLPVKVSARHRPWKSHLLICLVIVLQFFPLYVMLEGSMKDNPSFIANPWVPSPPSEWNFQNWFFALRLMGPYIVNTFFVATTGTIASLALSILGAYFFARYKMPFSGILWAAFLFLMLMPTVANIVPLFLLLKQLSLLNTLWALVIVGAASSQAFNIVVLRNFIEDLPKDLFDAAEMDGASHLQQVMHVVVPLSRSIIGTLAILAFLGLWNEFLLPLIVLRDKQLYTIGVGLIYLDGEYVKQWGQIMAAYLVASLPIVVAFLFCMRLFVRGLSSGALKG